MNPLMSFLVRVVYAATINSRPFRYHLYPTGIPRTDDNQQEEDKVQFINHAQVIQFLNLTHLSSDPMNEGVYECISLTSSDILSLVWEIYRFILQKEH
ncbi:uncharacterized protein RHIMIDRAFT_79342 [Rhizopus microsporus ATCC 52813]|uniref:Uncharacterized protein n=1 Tax=Rhizopus microsporus ATCC 52813 TaxID=1340429 RepID=A0A2G4SHI5_RHIZD|nr:uncharacterized protein RHIMIDRAFT_79342 [Rhizopus microsporus ATCC 52813]PHZ08212.1 hypothetical protein RHIMIDRAFT_79342 [Rhizopus microsporus ATCC 52813]